MSEWMIAGDSAVAGRVIELLSRLANAALPKNAILYRRASEEFKRGVSKMTEEILDERCKVGETALAEFRGSADELLPLLKDLEDVWDLREALCPGKSGTSGQVAAVLSKKT